MNAEKKNTIKNKINSVVQWVILLGVFGGILGAAIAWGEWKNIMQERMFKDSNERVRTEQHIAEPFSRYKMQLKNDSILMQQKFLNTAFDTINVRYANDEEDKKSRIKSRARRDSSYFSIIKSQKKSDSVQIEIQREQRNTSNAIQLILQKLDTAQ